MQVAEGSVCAGRGVRASGRRRVRLAKAGPVRPATGRAEATGRGGDRLSSGGRSKGGERATRKGHTPRATEDQLEVKLGRRGEAQAAHGALAGL